MKARLFKWVKRIGNIALVAYFSISLLSYGLGVWLRAHMSPTPFFVLPSPNAEWLLMAYEYHPGGPQNGQDSAGVYRIYDKQSQLQAEVEADRYAFYNNWPYWVTDNEVLLNTAPGGMGPIMTFPANGWVRFKAGLP